MSSWNTSMELLGPLRYHNGQSASGCNMEAGRDGKIHLNSTFILKIKYSVTKEKGGN